MKKQILLILSALTLASCGGTPASSSSSSASSSAGTSSSSQPASTASSSASSSKAEESSEPASVESSVEPSSEESSSEAFSSSSSEEVETYVIRVTAPTRVQYSLSKERAAKGEEVTLTITELPSSMTIKEVTANNKVLSGNDGVYTFTMPDQSVAIKISVNVGGDVAIFGDIAAVLEKGDDGIYVARNVAVTSSSKAKFSYAITGADGERVILDSTDLDELRCFADVTFAYNGDYELQVAGGCTYDFFYDPSSDYPCYVRRVSVDYLPATEEGFYSLFDGSMRSESTVHYPGLKGITYSTLDTEDTENPLKTRSDYKVYDNNVTLATITDELTDDVYYSYKNYNEEKGELTLVDTYSKNLGNNDVTRLAANNYGAYSAHYDVIDTKDEDSLKRSQITARDAKWTVEQTAHYGTYLEREIMYAYRVGFSRDEVTASNISISSVRSDDDSFVTTISSFVEYNSGETTYTAEMHEAHVFNVTISFDKAGRLLNVDFAKNLFKKAQWDFAAHAPQTGQTGRKVKTVKAAYTYGEPETGAPEFDASRYFISEVTGLRFYNADTECPTDDGKSYLHYSDKVSLNKTSENDKLPNLAQFSYLPITALDRWQYGPVASSNEAVIQKTASDLSYVMTCVSIGESTVTFCNYTASSGIHFDEDITVVATKKFHSVYLYSLWGEYASVGTDTSESATIVAGQTDTSFKVGVTPDSAPVIYDAQSNNEELLKIVDQKTGLPGTGKVACGEKLTLDTTGAANITKSTKVSVTITSDWFQEGFTSKTFVFTIIPAAIDVTGTNWNMEGYEGHVKLNFTNEAYEGQGYDHIGTLIDDGYDVEKNTYAYDPLTIRFAYSYSKGTIVTKLLSINFSSNQAEWSTSVYDYNFDVIYDAETDRVGVFLAEAEWDDYYEDYTYYPLYGEVDESYQPYSYSSFVRVQG